jgi:hypothetical protein
MRLSYNNNQLARAKPNILRGRNGRNEWPDLVLDGDGDDRGAVRVQRLFERGLYLFPRARLD